MLVEKNLLLNNLFVSTYDIEIIYLLLVKLNCFFCDNHAFLFCVLRDCMRLLNFLKLVSELKARFINFNHF